MSSAAPRRQARSAPHEPSLLEPLPQQGPFRGFSRARVRGALSAIRNGQLTLVEGAHRETFGAPDDPCGNPVVVSVHDPRLYSALLLRGTMGAAEAFMDGHWTCDDVSALIRLLFDNRDALAGLERSWSRALAPLVRFFVGLRRNDRARSRHDIRAHYDLGNEFFALFLDPTLMYSCAYFASADLPLHTASVAKIDRICQKLRLTPSDHLLEVGTGWGGFAIHAARHYGCRVTTTTISERQYEHARNSVLEAGLGDRITLLRQDYRDLEGSYDKLVSIEMIEAVGARDLPTFFEQCSRLLKPDGLMLIQSIVIADHAFAQASREIDFLKKYIFPGSCLPSVCALANAASRTDLRTLAVEDIGPHYCLTLRHWRDAYRRNLAKVRALGFDERFVRMWDFYFSYCEGVFASSHTSDVQWLWAKPGHVVPLDSVSAMRWTASR